MDRLPLYHSLTQEQQQLLAEHLKLVIEANERVNLTRIEDEESGMLLHIEDSLTALHEVNEAPEGNYADLGSGAGYPGIPLAVAAGRKTMLVDARKKKMDEVENMLRFLGLENQVRVFAGRAELLARSERGKYAVITARALAKVSVLLELASPLLMKGGRLVCYKANMEGSELDDARRVCEIVGMRELSNREMKLGDEYTRRILVYEKKSNAKVSLPRLEGQAQKNPL